tara:strand:+ start:2777 stop:3205 length:429 start_codon:yes stop_codon:yes gene_type:complete
MDLMSLSSIFDTPRRIKNVLNKKNLYGKDIYFKKSHSFEKRKDESFRILQQYPTRIPIICERANQNIQILNRKKYLVPDDLTMGNFMFVIRKRLYLAPEMAIYLFVNNKFINGSQSMSEIYEKNKDDDGFLYIHYSGESTFG